MEKVRQSKIVHSASLLVIKKPHYNKSLFNENTVYGQNLVNFTQFISAGRNSAFLF